jgi:geranylgeranyl pyrophosphate synthase
MIHTYSLIHDDLPSMDDDDLRRGRATCHKKFGEATAILAGDALQVLSFRAIAEDDRLPGETRLDLISRLAAAAAKMVVGQQLDLEAEGRAISIAEIENVHRNKTGALICFSAEAGAIIAGAGAEATTAVSLIGEKLGLLFQIRDDVLDVTETTEALGKTAGKDTASAKATYPAIGGIERTEQLAKQVYEDVREAISKLDVPNQRLIEIANFIITRRS